ncbi:hypothetical protein WA026_008657 [Henosepilachna vigintioctopunctata]|uniref:Ecdysteroid UDP-glucosyltransferase n=1 Tax=Henosepilachna vigintioctopunctata TaxID=420089 RepID=A0AAW1UJ48_9CUCU
MFFLEVYLFTCLCNFAENANIVAITPTPFFTHQAAFRPLWRALAKRGHNVTLITTDPMLPHENITQIDISETYTISEKYKTNGTLFEPNLWKNVMKFIDLTDDMVKFQLTHPKIIQMKDPKNYHCHLILTELYMPSYFALG